VGRSEKNAVAKVSAFPWWAIVLVALAAGAWFLGSVLGAVGESLLLGLFDDDDPMGAVMVSMLSTALSLITPFLVLALCFAAVLSFYRHWRRSKLFKSQTDLQSIRDLSWQDFEHYIAEAYRRKGYAVEETGSGADGGIDLIAKKGGSKVLVQCKNWRTHKVGVRVVRELFGLVKAEGAARGDLVVTGEFTAEAREFARQNGVDLVDGEGLTSFVEGRRTAPFRAENRQSGPPDESDDYPSPIVDAPSCPRCQSPMVKRTAKRGTRAGSPFWGCSKWPRCRGTREWEAAVAAGAH